VDAGKQGGAAGLRLLHGLGAVGQLLWMQRSHTSHYTCLFGEHVRGGVECQPRVQLRGYTGTQPCRVERSRARPE
jgi:hypothetical protein